MLFGDLIPSKPTSVGYLPCNKVLALVVAQGIAAYGAPSPGVFLQHPPIRSCYLAFVVSPHINRELLVPPHLGGSANADSNNPFLFSVTHILWAMSKVCDTTTIKCLHSNLVFHKLMETSSNRHKIFHTYHP
jgi:hypothetical protein